MSDDRDLSWLRREAASATTEARARMPTAAAVRWRAHLQSEIAARQARGRELERPVRAAGRAGIAIGLAGGAVVLAAILAPAIASVAAGTVAAEQVVITAAVAAAGVAASTVAAALSRIRSS